MILENLKNKKIILASQSPRRQQLLQETGIVFETITKQGIDENTGNLKGKKAALFLAAHKANQYKELLKKDTIIITADTIVCLKGEILNKPENAEEAKKMLNKLSGNKHEVITGVCIQTEEKKILFAEKTKVYFKKLCNKEIDYYVEYYKPLDKAGAYGIQEWIGFIAVEKIKGSYFNVVGLPVQKIYKELAKI